MKTIELLLTENVDNLGIVGDVVKVKPGYARNYLLPFGLATDPSPGNIQRLSERRAQVEAEMKAQRTQQESMLEKLAGPFKFAGELNAKLFTKVVEELYHVHKAGKIGVNVLCDLIFNWNTYGEVTNENKLMYFRVKVQPRAEVEVGLDSPVGGVEGGVTASKSEVVYERIGSETVSYI